jgi:hypothetical protein
MKRTFLLFATVIFSLNSFAQTIRRVNNIPGAASGANTYATIPAAISAATNGDIIYIEPSTIPYGDAVTVDKQLSLIGNGNFLEQNPNTPFDKKTSMVSNSFTFSVGSENSSVTGIYFTSIVILETSNILVKQCRLDGSLAYFNNADNIVVTKSFIWEISKYQTTGGQNWSVTNNVVRAPISSLQSCLLSNNTFVFESGEQLISNAGSTITGNIFFKPNTTTYSSSNMATNNLGSSITNNLIVLASGSTLPSSPDAGSNVYSSDPGNIFEVSNPQSSNPQKDAEYKLKSGSPAVGVGAGGADAGAFGGVSPYTLSTLPNIPIITSAVSSGVGNSTTPLSVTISVRSN